LSRGAGYLAIRHCFLPRGGRVNKKFNAQPKILIGKTQAQIAQVKNKIEKAQIAQEKIKSVKRKRKLCNFF